MGKNLPTGLAERIQVELVEVDERDGVFPWAEPEGGQRWLSSVRRGRPRRHLVSIADLERPDVERILDTAGSLAAALDRELKKLPTLRGRTVVNLFYESSTRTLASFELAAKRLSADTMSLRSAGSSVDKGESLRTRR